ncbi:hypothetical protein FKM82_002068 [Ascaphus truei]
MCFHIPKLKAQLHALPEVKGLALLISKVLHLPCKSFFFFLCSVGEGLKLTASKTKFIIIWLPEIALKCRIILFEIQTAKAIDFFLTELGVSGAESDHV